ncbi:hypothetical protein CYMTET_26177 [Cymbomonas tetramitiformis]|uniref:MYND-type domain-containing protein n=1 Tax=Cymbomonas tetramitiformis TaxID=36881 RepID=A0AAE0FSL6_9CHLO|nr:hypothetical protein CYMTET_26177 [Cymbomonas tetramitiformis]
MASHFEDEDPNIKECANCGSTENLGRCSRCHSAWFCSVKCQKAYWPFHKEWCKKNDFADMIEKSEPKFANWMRKHGKVAVLKDDEVDRIERKVATMDDMYGKANPNPLPPSYSPEDLKKMNEAEEKSLLEQRSTSQKEQLWLGLHVPTNLGMECERYKWRQNQSYVEMFVRLPEGATGKHVSVELQSTHLRINLSGDDYVKGDLFLPIKQDESTWLIQDGILEITMLKRYRKGSYADGKTNADTFWYSVFQKAPEDAVLALDCPPTTYYSTPYDQEDRAPHRRRGRSSKVPMIGSK